MPILMFEIELPAESMAERNIALSCGTKAWDVEDMAAEMADLKHDRWDHIYTCTASNLTCDLMESYIHRSELKIGTRPKIVMVDYIGLVGGEHGSRYEKTSAVAERLKKIAKSCNVVLVAASQIRRKPQDEDETVNLHDGKESGSIENSAQLVIGLWRESSRDMRVKVLKSTKGGAGMNVLCDFNGATMQIREATYQNGPIGDDK